jgi:hypothetical protein
MTASRAKVTQKRLFFVLRCGAWISRWDDLVFAADLTAALPAPIGLLVLLAPPAART